MDPKKNGGSNQCISSYGGVDYVFSSYRHLVIAFCALAYLITESLISPEIIASIVNRQPSKTRYCSSSLVLNAAEESLVPSLLLPHSEGEGGGGGGEKEVGGDSTSFFFSHAG